MSKHLVKQVAKVIGKKLAVHELSIVAASDTQWEWYDLELEVAFRWDDTPQGSKFWRTIHMGRWPYNYTRGK